MPIRFWLVILVIVLAIAWAMMKMTLTVRDVSFAPIGKGSHNNPYARRL